MNHPVRSDPTQFPFGGTNTNPKAWNGVPNSTETVLYVNQDLANTVSLGFRPQISAGGLDTIPLPPNGTITLSASRSVYAVAPSGTANMLVIPGGVAYFQGLTQGSGQLVLPSMRSPNFQIGISGWIIRSDGSAEFNDVIIRNGQVVSGTALYYSGIPAAGNLIASISAVGGTDSFGNTFKAGVSSYLANLTSNLTGGAVELFVTGETGSASIEQNLDGAGHFGMQLASPQQGTAAVILILPSQWGAEGVPQVVIAGTNGNPVPGTNSLLEVQGQISTTALANIVANGGLIAQLGDIVAEAGNLIVNTIGKGLEIATGANGRLIKATLAGGTVTVANTSVTANTQIFVNHISIGANAGELGYTINPGVSFTINSTNAADANSVSCLLVERL